MRFLVIGLDGACLPVLDWIGEDGAIPQLQSLRAAGSEAPLESQLPPWTPSAWPSMYTGVNPGKHGVYDFHHFDGYDWDITNRSRVREFAIWELLSLRGFTSVVVNVPVTHPPRPFDGALVPGYIAPEAPTCHPPDLWSELDEVLDEYSLYGRTLDSTASDAELERELETLSHMRGEAFRYLVDQYEPDFGFVQFQTTDTVFHQCPSDEAIIQRIYGAVDAEVGRILEEVDADVTMVVSDHGIGPMAGHEFRVNDFLREEGWLAATPEGRGMPSWKSRAREGATDDRKGRMKNLAATGLEFAARVGLTSQRLGIVLERIGLEERVLDVVPVDLVRAGTEQVDFPASRAYMRSRTEMGVRLNLEGREPEGTVPDHAYEQTRAELIDVLERVETPGGVPVFEDVLPCEAVYEGPNLDEAPDIVTIPNAFDQFLVSNLKGAPFGDPTEPFEHKRHGLLLANGSGIDRTVTIDQPHLLDIAPTILSSFQLPISDRMDGEPLPIVEATGDASYPEFETSPVETDSAAVEQRLSDLGYLQ